MEDLNVNIGRNLRKIRLKRKLYQVDVATMTGLRSSYISVIERGKAKITMATFDRLVEGLGIKSSKLIE
jgi:transcriptional regulator with XRE-family HTH domain